ncbi:MAG: phosphoglycolate phosphatase [Thioalkalivibrionaceae bacterium]
MKHSKTGTMTEQHEPQSCTQTAAATAPFVSFAGWIFDLDGTLIDSAPDLLAALGRLLNHTGRDRQILPGARATVSHGADAMLAYAFPDLDAAERLALRDPFLDDYAACVGEASRPFDGIDELLEALEQRGCPWGIVTNKPRRFTTPLLERLGLDQRASVVVCGDTLAHAKPHPAPMVHAAKALGVLAENCIAIGDAERDIQAARAAGIASAVAHWGYLSADDRPHQWGATHHLVTPRDALAWLVDPATRASTSEPAEQPHPASEPLLTRPKLPPRTPPPA